MKAYWSHRELTLIHGDSLEVIPTLERQSVDLVLTDPPYSDRPIVGARKLRSARPSDLVRRPEAMIDYAGISPAVLREVFRGLSRAARRWIVATVDWTHAAHLEQRPPRGSRFVRCGVWVKPNGSPQFSGDRPAMGWEAIAILHRAGVRLKWNGGGEKAVWTYPVAKNNGHPTPKPVELWIELMRLFSNPADLVFDPFAGGGVTLEAAHLTGRRAIAVELEERWCEVIARRMEAITAQAPLFAPAVVEQLAFAAGGQGGGST